MATERKKSEDDILRTSRQWLQDLSNGVISHELEALTLEGLQIVLAQKGIFRCNFIIPNRLADRDGNWHVGAMATLIDDVGAAAIYSTAGQVKASVDFNISYFCSVKIQEEVVIEARVVAEKGKLSSVLVEIRRKDNGELVAFAKQWMASNNIKSKHGSKL